MYPCALPLPEQGTLFCNKSGKYAAPGLGCHRCYSAIVEMRTKGEVISNPGRRLSLCVAPYFADRGVGDMRGRVKVAPKSHPGGGAGLLLSLWCCVQRAVYHVCGSLGRVVQ